MNREFKRRMKREQRAQERAQLRGGARPPVPVQQQQQTRRRRRIRTYLGEIRSELRRVVWPTRQEVFTYSVVVVIVVTILTGVVFALDLAFAQGIVELFRPARP